jgi:hypothetical protein
MHRVAKTYLIGRDSVLVTDWGRAVSLSFYGRPRPVTTVLREQLFESQIFDIEGSPRPPLEKLNRPEIFLLDAWEPSPLNRFFRTNNALDAFRREHSVASIAARELNLQCTQIEETVHRIYRCVR